MITEDINLKQLLSNKFNIHKLMSANTKHSCMHDCCCDCMIVFSVHQTELKAISEQEVRKGGSYEFCLYGFYRIYSPPGGYSLPSRG